MHPVRHVRHYSGRAILGDWLDPTGSPPPPLPDMWPPEPPRMRIACHTCDAHRRIRIGGIDMVREQIDMWREGWRRVPEHEGLEGPVPARDYCPDCWLIRVTGRG